MLKANKSRWFEKLFTLYNRNLLKRRFHSFNVNGLKNLSNTKIPQIIYANHSGWWDGLVIFEICRRANLDFYVMMEEKQLKNLPLFRKLGAFSVIRENPREAVRSINYAVSLLKKEPSKTLLIFPQGEIQPNDLRPLKFFSGLSRLVEKTVECNVIPIAIRYEFGGQFKPEIFVSIGKADEFSTQTIYNYKSLTNSFEVSLTENLDNLKKDIIAQNFINFDSLFDAR
jgi:1-acyl-sn-glycerol-3-phosphate acyltransferase